MKRDDLINLLQKLKNNVEINITVNTNDEEIQSYWDFEMSTEYEDQDYIELMIETNK